jgi:DNA polymerase-3 subunit gamma/tau
MVAELLKGALDAKDIAPTYLFHGPRGTGKTSTARIVAKGLNCKTDVTGTPCDKCPSCRSIIADQSTDVYEIDGASNRGIGDVREIKNLVTYTPIERYKVFIIDEAHMLTREAFNAFLKTLEEPPGNTVFVLATTDVAALPQTILSRCSKYMFQTVPIEAIRAHVAFISQIEKVDLDNEAVTTIAEYADGSVRDALNILNQLKYSSTPITSETVRGLCGIVPKTRVNKLITAIGKHDIGSVFTTTATLKLKGEDFKRVTDTLLQQAKNLLICKTVEDVRGFPNMPSTDKLPKMKAVADLFINEELVSLITILNRAYGTMTYGTNLQLSLEAAIMEYFDRTGD